MKNEIVPGVAFLIPLNDIRDTPGVGFHDVPAELIGEIAAIDRVEHGIGAYSPIARDYPDKRPWYMHPDQEDNLLVFSGTRNIELYTKAHGQIEHFEVDPRTIKHKGKIIFEGPAIIGWGVNVFHRVTSPQGSISINFARHFPGFNMTTNFNIYDLNTETGAYSLMRFGALDQPLQDIGE